MNTQASPSIATPIRFRWDCECDEHYIHPHYSIGCRECGASITGATESKAEEISNHNLHAPAAKQIHEH